MRGSRTTSRSPSRSPSQAGWRAAPPTARPPCSRTTGCTTSASPTTCSSRRPPGSAATCRSRSWEVRRGAGAAARSSSRSSTTARGGGSSCRLAVGLSTPEVYRHFDRLHPDAPAQPAEPTELLAALASGEPVRLARALHNDLQEPAIDLRPELGDLIALGEAEGALRGMVSGSGPTCVFLCDSQRRLHGACVTALSASYDVVLSAIGPVAGAHVVSTREAEWDLR